MNKVFIGIALVVILGGTGYYFYTQQAVDDAAETTEITEDNYISHTPNGNVDRPSSKAPELSPSTEDAIPETPVEPLPPLEESDKYFEEKFSEENVMIAKVLKHNFLVRKIVAATDMLWRGQNPSMHFPYLKPLGDLEVEEKDGSHYLASSNYKRYDEAVKAVEEIDVQKVANIYKFLRPLFLEAYDELGNGDKDWDLKVANVIDQILVMDVPKDQPELAGKNGIFIYVDEKMEALPAPHKMLIRMGPDHTLSLHSKLSELKQALYGQQTQE